MVTTRLTWFLEISNILRMEQAGFRPQRSTNQQVATPSQLIKDALVARNILTAVFVDFTSAYNLVRKENFILKLTKIGIKHSKLNWIKHSLDKDHANSDMETICSNLIFYKQAYHQELSKAALFNVFIIEIAELVQTVTGIKCLLYADDLVLWYSAPRRNLRRGWKVP
ncbi:unnamed protein product [Rodentolepis nana]|uniref:Reverse transcriptase domain-containing protein n=1 Tax=Rodentolepis nana TaxID=102285 RepID=A0A0R3T4D7_RODNA|nr:unnamed protein product [Rodentolepis nana]